MLSSVFSRSVVSFRTICGQFSVQPQRCSFTERFPSSLPSTPISTASSSTAPTNRSSRKCCSPTSSPSPHEHGFISAGRCRKHSRRSSAAPHACVPKTTRSCGINSRTSITSRLNSRTQLSNSSITGTLPFNIG